MGAVDEQNRDDLIRNEFFFLRNIVHMMCETENKEKLIELSERARMHLNCITSLNIVRINEGVQTHDKS